MKNLLGLTFLTALSFTLMGCNGSSSNSGTANNAQNPGAGDPPATSELIKISGTAAIGAAISNTPLNAKCENGKGFEGAVTTDAKGHYSGMIIRSNFPCAFKITDAKTNLSYFSYAPDAQQTTVNLTPLTSLVVARANNQLPQDWYLSKTIALNKTAFDQAIATLNTELKSATNQTKPAGNPVNTPFVIGDAYDRVLDKFTAALNAQNRSYENFLLSYRDGNAFNLNLGTIVIDDSVKNDNVPTGNYRLKVTTTVMGTSTDIVLENMPKPANQSEFCSGFSDELAGKGYQIKSCTFNGQVGVIDSNLSNSGVNLSYQIKYEYTSY